MLYKNPEVQASMIANFGDVFDYLVAPNGDGDQDHWPYRVVLGLRLDSADKGLPEVRQLVCTLVTVAQGQNWHVADPDETDEQFSLTFVLPVPWTVETLEFTTKQLVNLAHSTGVQVTLDGEPLAPVAARVAGVR